MSDRLLVVVPGLGVLALEPETFREALAAGTAAVGITTARDPSSDGESLLEAEELAAALKLPQTWIEQKAREGVIPSIQAGRWRRFRRSEVERALAANGNGA